LEKVTALEEAQNNNDAHFDLALEEAHITNSVPALCVNEAQNTTATLMPLDNAQSTLMASDDAQNNNDVNVDEVQ
jgi:hypothetical protein